MQCILGRRRRVGLALPFGVVFLVGVVARPPQSLASVADGAHGLLGDGLDGILVRIPERHEQRRGVG